MRKGSRHTIRAKRKMSKSHKGFKHSDKAKKKISEARLERKEKLGYLNSSKTREKMSESHKGNIPHNKGMTFESEYGIGKASKLRLKISKGHKGQIPWIKNKHHTEGAKEKMREAKLLHPSPGMKGKHHTEEAKEKNRIAHLGIVPWIKGRHHTIETKRKILRRRTPSSLEEKFQGIVDKYNLPYKYVGNGKFFIERLNPDFVNTNNEKIAVEVYARYYKRRNKISIEEWKEKRSEVFENYGWKLIFFDEIEVTEANVLNKIKG